MAGHKRASMREGPLAQLFRRTDEGAEEQPAPGAPIGANPSPQPPARPGAEATPPSELPAPATAARPEPRQPTPQERLRAAFSSELPDDVLSPPRMGPP